MKDDLILKQNNFIQIIIQFTRSLPFFVQIFYKLSVGIEFIKF